MPTIPHFAEKKTSNLRFGEYKIEWTCFGPMSSFFENPDIDRFRVHF